MRASAAAVLACAASLVCAGAAHGACADSFSKVRQRDPLAPLVVGDSVTVGAGDALAEMGFAVDAVACRTFTQGLAVMEGRPLPDLVVVALGSNAAVSGAELAHALDLVGAFGRLVLVLPRALGGRPDPDGAIMRAFESAHPDQVSVLDWPTYSTGRDSWFAPDGLHLTAPGAQAFAQMIGEAIQLGPADRAEPRRAPAPEPPRRTRPPEPRASPIVVGMWHGLARALRAIATPVIRLVEPLLARSVALPPQDL